MATTDFGTIAFGGKTYTLTDQAELTNSVFPGWFGDAKDGEEYTSQWSAPAMLNNEEYEVVWQFCVVKGSEPEPDCQNWSNIHHVNLR